MQEILDYFEVTIVTVPTTFVQLLQWMFGMFISLMVVISVFRVLGSIVSVITERIK